MRLSAALAAAAAATTLHTVAGFTPGFAVRAPALRRHRSLTGAPVAARRGRLYASDEDGEDEDAADADDGVRWLPPLDPSGAETEAGEGEAVLPLFPLGAHVPGTETVLNIFEPRYRAMYNAILLNGSKRFCVAAIDPDTGRVAEVGTMFYLDDLKEVSQQTDDRVKFVCTHSVKERVRIDRVLNPQAWQSGSTYLKVVGSEIEDVDAATDTGSAEAAIMQTFTRVVELQARGNEDIRFAPSTPDKFGVSRDKFWAMVELWKGLLDANILGRQQEMQLTLQKRLLKFLSEKGQGPKAGGDASIRMSDLPADLKNEVQQLQERVQEELQPMLKEQTTVLQRLLQEDSHAKRLAVLAASFEHEERRLAARSALRSLGLGGSGGGGGGSEAAA